MTQTASQIAARHAEIDRRWTRHDAEQRANRRRRYSPCALRLRDLYKVRDYRWGPAPLPEEEEYVGSFIHVVCSTLAGLAGNPTNRIECFLETHAPWWDQDHVDAFVDMIVSSPTNYSADSAAFAIGLDRETRDFLKIKTIGAVDFLKEQRTKHRAAQHRLRQQRLRAKKRAAKPPKANLSDTRPWEAVGVSRATYYRRRDEFDLQLYPTGREN